MNTGILIRISVVVVLMGSGGAFAENWPQWRHDAKRSGVTSEEISRSMKQQWSLNLGKPAPAYEHQFRMCADYSYAPVAAEGLLFIPSNVSDQVMAFEIKTGRLKWRAVAAGPVRFAPIYNEGKVYFASDDGYLYCVRANDGCLIWKTRGVPSAHPEMKMLVNGRMVSRWPARGAPVLHNGIVYFGTGIWPEEGAFQNAVDANTGKMLWQNNALSYQKDGMCDHGKNYDISLPPQGYSAVINGKLGVASGRTLAAWFDLATGAMDPYTCFYVKFAVPRGAWYVAGNDNFWVQGGNWFAAHKDAAPEKSAEMAKLKSPLSISLKSPGAATYVMENRPFLCSDKEISDKEGEGREHSYADWIVGEDTMFATTYREKRDYTLVRGKTFVRDWPYNRLVARDMSNPKWTKYKRPAKKLKGPYAILDFPIKWEMETSLKAMIKAGGHLIAGENGRIAAISIPQKKGDSPEVVWEKSVNGIPVHTLMSDGNLVVVTDTGQLYCFGTGALSKPAFRIEPTVEHSPKNGYAFVLGWGDGTHVLELAQDSEWQVVVAEKDAAVVAKARALLNSKGVYGRRVQVFVAEDALELTPYWAGSVLVNDPLLFGSKEQTLKVAINAMRPFSGKMELSASVDRGLVKQLTAGKVDYRVAGSTLLRISAPEGAADWSHESGDSDNSFVSQDKLVKWPLGVLWYSGDIDRFFTPETQYQHDRNPYPLVKGGRLFIITNEELHAVDVYTGNYLWYTKMPATPYVKGRLMSSRLHGRPDERNFSVADDRLYCITGKEIKMYDTATGEDLGTLTIPEKLRSLAAETVGSMAKQTTQEGERMDIQGIPEWTETRLHNDMVISLVGKHLLAVNRVNGKTAWMRPSELGTITYTLGGDVLYALDCAPDEYNSKKEQHDKTGTLFALNPQTGKELWSVEFNYLSWPPVKRLSTKPWHRKPVPFIGYNQKHDMVILTYSANHVSARSAKDGSEVWRGGQTEIGKNAVYSPNILDDYLFMGKQTGGYLVDILTGKKLQKQNEIPPARTCGRLVANNHLVTYRDAATEMYNVDDNITIPFNSMRAGCTTSLIPANGVMTAPAFSHGCVCNYPMFASLTLVHMPGFDAYRPAEVIASWGADQREQAEKSSKGKTSGKKK